MAISIKVQNVYGDFLRSFKVFLDKVTRNTLNKIEWNYGSKPLEYYYMMNGHESFEYPVALIDIQDIQPVDGVSPIARNRNMIPNKSPHNEVIAANNTKDEIIILDKRWVNLMFNVTINTEDVASLLNYHDLFIGQLPLSYLFYDYTYITYIEVTDVIHQWDYNNDDIENIFLKMDPTYRYHPEYHHKESNEDFFTTRGRDRVQGRDEYPTLEGQRYFAMIRLEPIIKLNSVTKQIDKEQSVQSLTLNFEARIEIPNMVIWSKDYKLESIEVVIDTVSRNTQEYPILIDIPENFLTNKNISRGILLSEDNFKNIGGPIFNPDEETYPDPNLHANLVVDTVIPMPAEVASLWAVEDVTETSSSRFFIPLKHPTVWHDKDENGIPYNTRFYVKEMAWFEDFDFTNPFNYLKLVLFNNT
jgi:hypothetical protein